MAISHDDPVYPLRRHLAREIVRALGPNSEYVVAPSYGIPQPRMSELGRGLVTRCSIEWLIRRIDRMGGSVSLTITLGDVGREWSRARLRATAAKRRRQCMAQATAASTTPPSPASSRSR